MDTQQNIKIDNTQKNDKLKNIRDYIIVAIIAIVCAMILNVFFQLVRVDGDSMNNTLHNSQRLVLAKKAYTFSDMKYGDIIVAEKSNLTEEHIVKRLIGLPNDHIEIKSNKLYINDKLIKESYIKETMNTEDLDVIVPKNKIFVMGDNRNNSLDSRYEVVGFIDIETELMGKILGK